jgi:hypothetical protein
MRDRQCHQEKRDATVWKTVYRLTTPLHANDPDQHASSS